jgi:hypothetical protein
MLKDHLHTWCELPFHFWLDRPCAWRLAPRCLARRPQRICEGERTQTIPFRRLHRLCATAASGLQSRSIWGSGLTRIRMSDANSGGYQTRSSMTSTMRCSCFQGRLRGNGGLRSGLRHSAVGRRQWLNKIARLTVAAYCRKHLVLLECVQRWYSPLWPWNSSFAMCGL